MDVIRDVGFGFFVLGLYVSAVGWLLRLADRIAG